MRLRHAATAGIVLFALVGLSACRSDPQYAAYVGDFKLTEDKVTQLVKDDLEVVRKRAAAAGIDPKKIEEATSDFTREQAVAIVVADTLCQRLKAEKGFTYKEPALVTPASELNTIDARAHACLDAVQSEPVAPTEADIHEVYLNGIKAGVINASVPFETVKGQLSEGGHVARALGQRKILLDAAGAADVSVNPRYRPLAFPLLTWGQAQAPALAATIGQDQNVVIPATK